MTTKWILILAATFGAACAKPKEVVLPSKTIYVSADHHGLVIPEADLYIQYNTSDFPGWSPAAYKQHLVTDTAGKGAFAGVPLGVHFLMATGYDRTIDDDVKGYLKISVTESASTFSVPVSE